MANLLNQVNIVAVISIVAILLGPFPTTVSGKDVTITGTVECTSSCVSQVDKSQSASGPSRGIKGATVRVKCSVGKNPPYTQSQTATNLEGVFEFIITGGHFNIRECALFVSDIPGKCTQPSRIAPNGYNMDRISETTPGSGTYDAGPLQYYRPTNAKCP